MIIRLSLFISGCILGCKYRNNLIINPICGAGGYPLNMQVNGGVQITF